MCQKEFPFTPSILFRQTNNFVVQLVLVILRLFFHVLFFLFVVFIRLSTNLSINIFKNFCKYFFQDFLTFFLPPPTFPHLPLFACGNFPKSSSFCKFVADLPQIFNNHKRYNICGGTRPGAIDTSSPSRKGSKAPYLIYFYAIGKY